MSQCVYLHTFQVALSTEEEEESCRNSTQVRKYTRAYSHDTHRRCTSVTVSRMGHNRYHTDVFKHTINTVR